MYTYDTVSQAISGLKKRGYTTDFNVENDCLVCHATPLKRMPDEFGISEVNGCEAWGEGLREVGSQNSEFRIQEGDAYIIKFIFKLLIFKFSHCLYHPGYNFIDGQANTVFRKIIPIHKPESLSFTGFFIHFHLLFVKIK